MYSEQKHTLHTHMHAHNTEHAHGHIRPMDENTFQYRKHAKKNKQVGFTHTHTDEHRKHERNEQPTV